MALDEQVRAARDGDPRARAAVVEWLYPQLWRYLSRRRVYQGEVGDLVQDTIADILAKLHEAPDTADEIHDWALGFAWTTLRKHETKRRRREIGDAKFAAHARVMAHEPSFREQLSKVRRWRLLPELLSRLPTRYRRPLQHRLLDGRDYESIARLENIPREKAWKRVFEGMRKLLQLLEAAQNPPSSSHAN